MVEGGNADDNNDNDENDSLASGRGRDYGRLIANYRSDTEPYIGNLITLREHYTSSLRSLELYATVCCAIYYLLLLYTLSDASRHARLLC